MTRATKIEWIDRAKGIGIFFVVLGHALRGLNNASLFEGTSFKVVDYMIYTFHMPLFFFLSGIFFIKSLEKRGFYTFINNKFSSLFYLYLLWSLIQFLVQFTLNKYTNGNTVLTDILIIPFVPKGHMWFLYVLLILFIFNAFVFSIIPQKRFKSILTVLLLISLFLRVLDFTEIVVFKKAFKNMFFFELGIAFSFLKKSKILLTSKAYILLLLSFLGYLVSTYISFSRNLIDYDSQILTAFFGVIFFCFLSYLIKSKELKYLGRYSLEIYLAHILFASGTRIVLEKVFHIESLKLHILAGLLIGIIAPLLIVEVNKKYNTFNFLFKNPFKA